MKKKKRFGRKEMKKMALFNKKRNGSSEELNGEYEEFEKLGNDTDTIDLNNGKQIPKQMPVKPNSSQNKPVSQDSDDGLPVSLKPFVDDFNKEFGKIVEVDKNFNLLFAIYVEIKRGNRISAGQNVLLEDLIQALKEASQ